MNTIHKQTLDMTDRQTVLMPVGAKILSVAEQRGELCVWFQCNPTNPKRDRVVWIIGTGQDMPDGVGAFIGTVVMHRFVWHVFAEIE